MKNILKIYKRDMKSIVTNPIAIIVILALIFLPSLYAWFNIKSSWDPYSNTKGIAVAIVNNDIGSSFNEKEIHIGDEIIESLKTNEQMGWRFVDEKTAMDGVERGDYYASVIIPEDFSKKITSIINSKKIEKAKLNYYINEKLNAVAPKITSKGASSIQQEVTKNFIETVDGAILEAFNKIGEDLEEYRPKIGEFKSGIQELNDRMPEIKEKIDLVQKGVIKGEELTDSLQKNMPLIEETLNKGVELTKSFKDYSANAKENINSIAPTLKKDLQYSKTISDNINSLSGNLYELNASDEIQKVLNSLKNKSVVLRTMISNTKDIVDKINISNSPNLNILSELLGSKIKKLEQYENEIDSALVQIESGNQVAKETLDAINNISRDVSNGLEIAINDFDSKFLPEINSVADKIYDIASNSNVLANEATSKIPDVKNLLNKISVIGEGGKEDVYKLEEKLPEVQVILKKLNDKINELDNAVDINELIRLLKTNPEEGKTFISSPVELEETSLFKIPNYGSAMAPFFTTLSLWVGGLILVSILSVEVPHEFKEKLKYYEIYFGKSLLFITISLLQALCVSLGDIYFLGTYTSNKTVFVLGSMFTGFIFMSIIYTFVSVFGSVGKVLGIIGLVIQLSASGGTFPIQVTPEFFQKVNPYLPFTYAIQLMREATGGVIWDVVRKDILILLIYVAISILIALVLKEPINKSSVKFVERFKESKLGEH